jgi:hypothetical protein
MTCHFSSLRKMILIATFALLPMAAVNASAQNAARVNIPFGFLANHHFVPAGTYDVLPSENSVTLIHSDTRKPEAILLIQKATGNAIESRGRMEFYVSGSRHVLIDVQFAGSSSHSMLLGQPKREQQIAGNNSADAKVQLAMK